MYMVLDKMLCSQKLEGLFKSYPTIEQFGIVGKRNSDGGLVKEGMIIVVYSNDTIKGLELAKLQSNIEFALGFKVGVYERCELELDENLKNKVITNRAFLITR